MAKGKKKGKKKGSSEFDDLFESKPDSGGGWLAGVSAMAVDGADAGGGIKDQDLIPAAKETSTAPKPKAMEVDSLKPVKMSMKRGARTTIQKKRKQAKVAKALARTEMKQVKVATVATKKQKVASLKSVY